MKLITPWALGLIQPLIGCGDRIDTIADALMRDSSGVRIVENINPIWTESEAWRLGPTPSLDIGGADGDPDQQLFRVVDAVRLSDGRIVVANSGSNELLFFAANGSHLLTAGGEGGGPGEFQAMTWMHLRHDSLIIFDWRNRTLSVFHPDGQFGRSVPVRFSRNLWGVLSDGALLATAPLGSPEDLESGLMRPDAVLVRYSADGQSADTVVTTGGQESFMRIGEGSIEIWRLPFGRSTWNVVRADRFYVADSDAYEIKVYAHDGSLEMLIRKQHENLTAGQSDLDAFVESQLQAAGDDRRRQSTAQALLNFPMPETFPAFGWNASGRSAPVLLDDTGHLWVLEYNRPGDEEYRWSVFDPEGRLLGEVVFPVVLEPMHIGDDFVLGKWRDDFDVEHVVLYNLIKPN